MAELPVRRVGAAPPGAPRLHLVGYRTGRRSGTRPPDLAKAAEQARDFQTYGMPDDWANYGGVLEALSAKYGFEVKRADTDMTSMEEITKYDAEKANPVAVSSDIGLIYGPIAEQVGVVPPICRRSAENLPAGLERHEWRLGRYLHRRARRSSSTPMSSQPCPRPGTTSWGRSSPARSASAIRALLVRAPRRSLPGPTPMAATRTTSARESSSR